MSSNTLFTVGTQPASQQSLFAVGTQSATQQLSPMQVTEENVDQQRAILNTRKYTLANMNPVLKLIMSLVAAALMGVGLLLFKKGGVYTAGRAIWEGIHNPYIACVAETGAHLAYKAQVTTNAPNVKAAEEAITKTALSFINPNAEQEKAELAQLKNFLITLQAELDQAKADAAKAKLENEQAKATTIAKASSGKGFAIFGS